MTTTTRARKSRKPSQAEREQRAEARQARAASLKAELDAFLAEADPDELAAAMARFAASYSERNCALIVMQDEDATEVHGYWAWRYRGRKVTAYPEGEHAITIVAYRGGDKDQAGPGETADYGARPGEHDVTADTGKRPGEISSDDLKTPSRHFALDTVHDIRRTLPLLCGECGEPIRMTGTEKPAKGKGGRSVHLYTHADGKPEHRAYPARQETPAEPPAEGER